MNALVTNDGLTTWIGFESSVYATIYFTHPTTGHQCKKVCFEEIEVLYWLTETRPGGLLAGYEANIHRAREVVA